MTYDARAAVHKPTAPADLAREVRRLHVEHDLSALDISVALRLPLPDVIEALANPG